MTHAITVLPSCAPVDTSAHARGATLAGSSGGSGLNVDATAGRSARGCAGKNLLRCVESLACSRSQVSFDPDIKHAIGAMTRALQHRGPDGEGLSSDARAALRALAELAIINREGGAQPMCNEDRTVWITVQRRNLQPP